MQTKDYSLRMMEIKKKNPLSFDWACSFFLSSFYYLSLADLLMRVKREQVSCASLAENPSYQTCVWGFVRIHLTTQTCMVKLLRWSSQDSQVRAPRPAGLWGSCRSSTCTKCWFLPSVLYQPVCVGAGWRVMRIFCCKKKRFISIPNCF